MKNINTVSQVADEQKVQAGSSALLENTDDIIWSIDLSFRLIFFNSAYRKSFQKKFKQEPLPGLNISTFFNINHLKNWPELYQRAFRGEKFSEKEYFTDRNENIFIQIFFNPIIENDVITGVNVVSRNITEKVRMEEGLLEAQERFRKMAAINPEGIVIHEKGVIIEINQALADMFGYEMAEAPGKPVLFFAAPESHQLIIEKIKTGNVLPYEAVGLRKDGSVFPIEVSSKYAPYNGKMIRISILRDITERKLKEQEREELINQLQSALAEVKMLSGLLPICSWCKNIHTDKGYWQQIESYISENSGAIFSHGICPDCKAVLAEKTKKDLENNC